MHAVWTIFRKDLGLAFKTMPLYVTTAVFLGLSGYFFYWELNYFSAMCVRIASSPILENRGYNLTEAVLGTFFMNMGVLLLLLVPVLTMRSFSGERKEGTLETLLTYPVRDGAVLWGKFLAGWISSLCLVGPTVLFIWFANVAGGRFDAGVVLSAYLGVVLLCLSLTAFGLMVSVVTDSPVVSMAFSVGLLAILWSMGWGIDVLPERGRAILEGLSVFQHYRRFTSGVIHVTDVIYFVLFSAVFFIMTKEWLGMRRWRG